MLQTLVLQDHVMARDGLIIPQVQEAHRIIAVGIIAQKELVDLVVLNGDRLAEFVFDNPYFYQGSLQIILAEYDLSDVRIINPSMHAGSDPERSLREKYGALEFLTDCRPRNHVAYQLEW